MPFVGNNYDDNRLLMLDW